MIPRPFGAAPSLVLLAFAVAGIGAYLVALWCARTRGRAWPEYRALLWAAGWCMVGWALWPPKTLGEEWMFTDHMIGHVLLGMAGPLLLVLARPVSLMLCALPQRQGRAVARLLDTPYVRFITHPVVAAVLDMGGLWVLYGTGLFHAMHEHAWVAVLVHVHVLASGWLFTAVITEVEPTRRPHSFGLRAAVLIAATAAHDILAKRIYAAGDLGMSESDTHRGAMVMYYLGDGVDILLIVLLCSAWYRATGRRTGFVEREVVT